MYLLLEPEPSITFEYLHPYTVRIGFDATGQFCEIAEESEFSFTISINETLRMILPMPQRPCYGYFQVYLQRDRIDKKLYMWFLKRFTIAEELEMEEKWKIHLLQSGNSN